MFWAYGKQRGRQQFFKISVQKAYAMKYHPDKNQGDSEAEKNLKRFLKHMKFYLIQRKKPRMINMGMTLSYALAAVKVGFSEGYWIRFWEFFRYFEDFFGDAYKEIMKG